MRSINQSLSDSKAFPFRTHERRYWRPGEPILKNFAPDPLAALVRNAAAHAAQPAPAPLPFRPHTRRPADVAADRRAA